MCLKKRLTVLGIGSMWKCLSKSEQTGKGEVNRNSEMSEITLRVSIRNQDLKI